MSNIIIAVDTEGTGIDVKKDRVAEIAAVKYDLDTMSVVGTYHQLINPGVPMPQEAFEVHGLSDEILKDQPKFKEIAADFFNFVANEHIVIHNAPYDVGILDAECKRHKVKQFSSIPLNITDSLAMARFAFPSRKNTLDALCDRLEIDRSKRTLHGALIDCELLAAVYPGLVLAFQHRQDLVSTLLPQHVTAPLPEDLPGQVALYLAVNEMTSFLEKYKKNLREQIEINVDGKPAEDEDFEIKWSVRKTTNWEKVTIDHLSGVNLEDYVKESNVMTISRK